MKYKRVTWPRFIVGMIIFLPLFGFLLALRFGAIQNYEVTSASMEPTLRIGDRVFMDRIEGYMPLHGDVIVLENPRERGELITKRVIGLSGDTVQIRNGYLYVNGKEQIEMYLSPENARMTTPDRIYHVESQNAFVLGDNRNVSYDSRMFGSVPVSRIKGKLTFIYWPLKRFGDIQ